MTLRLEILYKMNYKNIFFAKTILKSSLKSLKSFVSISWIKKVATLIIIVLISIVESILVIYNNIVAS